MAGELHITRSEMRILQETLNAKTNQKWFSKTYAMLKEGANKVKHQQSITSGSDHIQSIIGSESMAAQQQATTAGRRASASTGVQEPNTGQAETHIPKSISRDGDFPK